MRDLQNIFVVSNLNVNDLWLSHYGLTSVLNTDRMKLILDKNIRGVADCDGTCFYDSKKDICWHDVDGIRVCNYLYDMGVNEEYLNTSIIDKDVYVLYTGWNNGLPVSNVKPLYAVDKNKHPKDILESRLARQSWGKVNTNSEKTFADLYENWYWYKHNITTGEWDRITDEKEAKQNLACGIIARRIFEWSGSPYDRIADYARIILFLLTKVELNNEEKQIFKQLLDYAPDITKIKQIVDKETLIQKEVKKLKEHIRNL